MKTKDCNVVSITMSSVRRCITSSTVWKMGKSCLLTQCLTLSTYLCMHSTRSVDCILAFSRHNFRMEKFIEIHKLKTSDISLCTLCI